MAHRKSDDDVKGLDNPVFDDAVSMEDASPAKSVSLYQQLLSDADNGAAMQRIKEESIVRLASLYAKQGQTAELRQLLVDIRPFFSVIPKSRTAKIMRSVIDVVIGSPDLAALHEREASEARGGLSAGKDAPPSAQVAICLDAIAWCQAEKRTFLKQRIQARLAALYVKLKQYTDALPLIAKLTKEVKKFDDKLLLVEIFLIESRAQLALQNIPKAKGALTAARSNANSIYCPPLLQAEIDLQAGILCSVEGDYKTSFSYFYESFEGYSTMKDSAHAVRALKYMLLSKIMNNQYEDVYATINGKAGVKYAGIEIDAMKAITDAYKARSIDKFQRVYKEFDAQLAHDWLIEAHLNELQEKLLEQNLIRLIEPYERVQIEHVAKLIKLERAQVEAKLSEMILDNKLHGILDQGTGDLILFSDITADSSYTSADATVKELNNVVDRLYSRAKQLTR